MTSRRMHYDSPLIHSLDAPNLRRIYFEQIRKTCVVFIVCVEFCKRGVCHFATTAGLSFITGIELMRRVSIAMAGLMLALLVLSPAVAADKAKKEKKAKPAPMPGVSAAMGLLRGVTLTDEQKEKVKEIGASFNDKLVAIQAKTGLSPEAKKERAEALAKAKAEGKTGKELREAVKGIGEPSKEQKAAMKEVMEERKAIAKEMKDALLAILTDDQRAQVQAKAAPKKEKKNKDK